MLEPYSDAPTKSGLLRITPERLQTVVDQWVDAGFQVRNNARPVVGNTLH